MAAPDSPIDETTPILAENMMRETIRKLNGGNGTKVCKISAEILKAWGEVKTHTLYEVLSAVAVRCRSF